MQTASEVTAPRGPLLLPSFPSDKGGVWARSQEALPLAHCGTLTLFHDPWGPAVPCGRGSPAVSSQNGRGRQKGCCLARVPHPMTSGGWLGPGPRGHRKGGRAGDGAGELGLGLLRARVSLPRPRRAGRTDAGCPLLPLPRPPSCPLLAWTTGYSLPDCWGPGRPLAQTRSAGRHTRPTLIFVFTDGGVGGSSR